MTGAPSPDGDGSAVLVPDATRTHNWWNAGTYRTARAPDLRFVSLGDIIDGAYTVYFPVEPNRGVTLQ